MYVIHDKENGIVVNHSSAWTEDARIAWYDATEHNGDLCQPLPKSLRECTCVAKDLIAGRFTQLTGDEPPVNVLTRAVALAVETYLRHKLTHVLEEDIYIRRGKL